jgi:hypothetical protein
LYVLFRFFFHSMSEKGFSVSIFSLLPFHFFL